MDAPRDDLTFLEPETHDNLAMHVLRAASRFSSKHVVLVGYSFWRDGDVFRDAASVDWFRKTFHRFAGDIYIIDPWPDQLHDMLSSATGSR